MTLLVGTIHYGAERSWPSHWQHPGGHTPDVVRLARRACLGAINRDVALLGNHVDARPREALGRIADGNLTLEDWDSHLYVEWSVPQHIAPMIRDLYRAGRITGLSPTGYLAVAKQEQRGPLTIHEITYSHLIEVSICFSPEQPVWAGKVELW